MLLLRRLVGSVLILLLPFLVPAARATSPGPDTYFEGEAEKRMARAVAAGEVRTVRQLIAAGDVGATTVGRDATNWLAIAVAARQKRALDALLELGALGDAKGKLARQALYAATLLHDIDWLRRLQDAGADLNNYGGGSLLLEVAIDTRVEAVLQFHLENGAVVNHPSSLGASAALSTAQARRFDVVHRLLDLGASPWAMDALGSTRGSTAERAARVPVWNPNSGMEQRPRPLLQRPHAAGFRDPAPTADEGRALRLAGRWPPPGRVDADKEFHR